MVFLSLKCSGRGINLTSSTFIQSFHEQKAVVLKKCSEGHHIISSHSLEATINFQDTLSWTSVFVKVVFLILEKGNEIVFVKENYYIF